ncbi:MAG: PAN/Apple domain-containing protein, partial [Pseudomonadota bacterium]
MKIVQRTAVALAWVMSSVLSLQAQEAVPDHRYLQYRDVDFFGADLTNLFDTTQEACARACSAQESCVAFTFNQRNNSCFPKSDITDRQ